MLKKLWLGLLLWWSDLFDVSPSYQCAHKNDAYVCHVKCGRCGHVCAFHVPDCRDVTERSTNTLDWYCRCEDFQG